MTLMNSLKISLYLVYTTRRYRIIFSGEISESDNSVKALYEARKIKSKLAQRKMLGIVTPSALSVEAVRKGFKTHSHSHSNTHTRTDFSDCKFCGKAHNKRECPAYGKVCNRCGQKNHFESKCRSSQRSNSERSGRTKSKFSQKCDKCGHKKVDCIEYGHDSDNSDDSKEIQDLSEQVQSLFYH